MHQTVVRLKITLQLQNNVSKNNLFTCRTLPLMIILLIFIPDDELQELGCECKGSLSLAHNACIQSWMNTQHSNRCEICKGTFIAEFTPVPPQSETELRSEDINRPSRQFTRRRHHIRQSDNEDDNGIMRAWNYLERVCILLHISFYIKITTSL